MVQRKKKYNISVITPFPVLGAGLESILGREKDFNKIETVNDYTQSRELIRKPNCDIIIAGLHPGFWGDTSLIEYNRRYNKTNSLPLLVCSDCDNPDYVASCLEAGANGYVLSTEPEKKIVKAVRDVLINWEYVSNAIIRVDPEKYERLKSLTFTESEVLKLRSKGLGSKAISTRLGMRHRTVQTHLRNIRSRLGIHNAEDFYTFIVQYAIRQDRIQR